MSTRSSLAIVDVGRLVRGETGREEIAAQLDAACRHSGFFVVTGHGIDPALGTRLEAEARQFFARSDEEKAEVAMSVAGRAWRGWFPVGGELTSGVPDRKEGYYFGAEHPPGHALVQAGTPLHGPNLFPEDAPGLRAAVASWMDAMTWLGRVIMRGLARGLGLDHDHFDRHLIDDPTVLFRIFHYPPLSESGGGAWGVAEHTDYGLLTILRQDATGGLEVKTPDGWIDAPPVPDSFVCNLGDMLERMTGGRYRSTPHRVRSPSSASAPDGTGRLSFPFFLDPGWDVRIGPLDLDTGDGSAGGPTVRRWDGEDPLSFDGTYGEYLSSRVARVFPDLFAEVAGTDEN